MKPEKIKELYEKLAETNPEIKLKGAKIRYTSLNGNMYTYVGENGLAIRLPVEVRETFLKRYNTHLYKTHSIIQKEYVAVPDSLLNKTTELKQYFDTSYEYAKTLKPKPSKK